MGQKRTSVGLRWLPRRGQRLAFLHHIHRENFCGAVTGFDLVHNARPNVPGLTSADWFRWLATLKHGEVALQQISGVEARVCMEAAVDLRCNLDMHDHSFVPTVRHVEFF